MWEQQWNETCDMCKVNLSISSLEPYDENEVALCENCRSFISGIAILKHLDKLAKETNLKMEAENE